mmetsp:Transcript_15551/g.36800  ORF Transcript_15551/g.36800 Transcript_15551/m.36800 type:complete len:1335 (+) Transcript_15551:72-4076(+)
MPPLYGAFKALWLVIWLHFVNGQQDATPAPAAFERFGDGECMTNAMLPIRGRSRRDLEHGECRAICNTDNCIGYTYAPCERICALHGEPELFRGLPDPERWSTKNGGGLIANTNGRCGSSCYVRKAPCQGGTLQSAGAFMNYESLTFGLTRTLECPFPHKGSVSVVCTSTGIQVAGGRCLRPCESGFVRDEYFEVKYPPTRHGEFGAGPCPSGTLGNMTIFCNDGSAAHVLGRCGTNCPAGALRSGSATIYYSSMDHEAIWTQGCPLGWVGFVDLECINGFTSIRSGLCQRHCDEGTINTTADSGIAPAVSGFVVYDDLDHSRGVWATCESPNDMLTGRLVLFCNDGSVSPDYNLGRCNRHCAAGQVGTGVRAVSHGIIPHMTNVTLECNPGFNGGFYVGCVDGVVILYEGFCYMNCVAGTITSNTITLPHEPLEHGENTTVECPAATHAGNITVVCDDGQARMVEGFCGQNCTSGFIFSNGARVNHPGIQHGTEQNISCPAPWGAEITFRCFDGSVRNSGRCGRQCIGGNVEQNGAVVFYTNLAHGESGTFICETLFASALTFSGSLELTCDDGGVVAVGLCSPDCPAGDITNNGARIIVPALKADTYIDTFCQPRAAHGEVRVTCQGGFQVVTQGSCGDPCPEDWFSNVNTRHTDLWLEEVSHDNGVWKDCPQDLSGQIYIHCFDGLLRVLEGQCGERCRSERVEVTGANFISPLLDHAEEHLQPCLQPYSDFVNLTCIFGELLVVGNCQLGCFAGDFVLPGGATVSHPDLVSGFTAEPDCPLGYAVGKVTIVCVNGNMEVQSGTCDAHCQAGRFMGPTGYLVNHLKIQHNETRLVACPAGYIGQLRLRCLAGAVGIETGQCLRNCIEGATALRDDVIFGYDDMEHGEVSREMKCPTGYVGSVRLLCTDSVVSVASGQCLAHCGAGVAQGAEYFGLEHEDFVSIVCPEVGEIKVRCFDGEVEVVEGQCLYGCAAGTVVDANGVDLRYPAFPHGTRINGTCSGLGVGTVELHCNNTVVALAGEGTCQRHCPPQFTESRDGSNVSVPYIEHLQQASVQCPNGQAGVLAVRCTDFVSSVFDGICGDMNCRAGEVNTNGALVAYPAINDKRNAGPGDCGEDFLGEPVFYCSDGIVSVLAVNLIRQPRIPGIDNVSEIGSSYNFTEEDRFKLCGCCSPPPDLPDIAALEGLDSMVVIYWAVAVGGAGFLVATASGYWIYKKRPPKVSKVTPEDGLGAGSSLAIQDNPQLTSKELALRDAAMSERDLALALKDVPARPGLQDSALQSQVSVDVDGRRSSAAYTARTQASQPDSFSQIPRNPQLLKPAREGTSKDWQYW